MKKCWPKGTPILYRVSDKPHYPSLSIIREDYCAFATSPSSMLTNSTSTQVASSKFSSMFSSLSTTTSGDLGHVCLIVFPLNVRKSGLPVLSFVSTISFFLACLRRCDVAPCQWNSLLQIGQINMAPPFLFFGYLALANRSCFYILWDCAGNNDTGFNSVIFFLCFLPPI